MIRKHQTYPLASMALIVTASVPAEPPTVPVITPVAELIAKPVGNPTAFQMYGSTPLEKAVEHGALIT